MKKLVIMLAAMSIPLASCATLDSVDNVVTKENCVVVLKHANRIEAIISVIKALSPNLLGILTAKDFDNILDGIKTGKADVDAICHVLTDPVVAPPAPVPPTPAPEVIKTI